MSSDVTSQPFPPGLTEFLAQHFSSLEKLEILLLLNRDADRQWSTMDVYNVILSTPHSVSRWLEDLVQTGLAQKVGDSSRAENCYQACGDETLKLRIANLADWYSTTPVRVIEAIYKRKARAAESFADAFRIKKPEES